jgi:DNA-binding NtrC family response regulator
MAFSGMQPPCATIPILLVDDDEVFRSGLALLLRDDQHEVLDVGSPQRANEIARLDSVRVLVTDFLPLGYEGYEFARQFHEMHPSATIILLTAYHANPHTLGERHPYVHVLHKPIDYEVLHAQIHRLAR